MNIMGYEVFIDSLETIDLKERKIINTINPHSYVIAKKDLLFQKALKASDVLIPDGSGIVLAAKQIHGKSIKKIAGADLHYFLLQKMNEVSGKVFYMGASQNTLKNIKAKIYREFPNIQVACYSPPFKANFSTEEDTSIVDTINSFNPDVLFIGMTAPKQEKWLYNHKDMLNFTIASSIGAVFDFYAGTIKRPHAFWINLHLEWLLRLLTEPKRLWRRNFISTPIFLIDMLREKYQL